MIISDNRSPHISEFKKLMEKTDQLLNSEAQGRDAYYAKRNGTELEKDVCEALTKSANNTPFENTIRLVSGASFPDIVANDYYGVEVKSTNKNHWKSIGSSILESTRVQSVERIYLTFGKLGSPVEFRSRPYEECLYGISVTHYPRYQIDMELAEGETIFDKMGVPYDVLRKLENPVEPVSRYYKSQLKAGETLWWASSGNLEEEAVPPTVKLWTSLSHEAKEKLTIQGYTLFPEVLESTNAKKYNRYALWLVTKRGVVNTNIRDSFSAGGKVPMRTTDGIDILMPAAFGRIRKYRELIEYTLYDVDVETLKEYWETDCIENNRLLQWCKMVAFAASTDPKISYSTAWKVLRCIFPALEDRKPKKQHNVYLKNNGREYINISENSSDKKVTQSKVIGTPFASLSIGDIVEHKSFGIGKIVDLSSGIITVEFDNFQKQFRYPDSLQQGFIKKV